MGKSLLIRSIMIGFILGIGLYGLVRPKAIDADLNNLKVVLSPSTLIKNGHLTICKIDKSSYEVVKTITMIVTAYSSTPDQTDDTPFITASGKHVTYGIVANNLLPFGTKVRIRALFGSDILTVQDRMATRKGLKHLDVWLPELLAAKKFGAKIATIEVIES